jgi:hypothetical protein
MFGDDAGRMHRRIAAGIAVSLAVHALVLTMQRHAPQRAPAAPRPIAVRLRPPQRTRPARPRSVIAVEPKPAPAQPDSFTVQQAPQPASAPEPPHFDREAARRMARSLANIRDPAREGTAIGQFPDPPLETETRAARAIGAAKRRDCKDGLPGGLLGPLLILADKKDSGCKW